MNSKETALGSALVLAMALNASAAAKTPVALVQLLTAAGADALPVVPTVEAPKPVKNDRIQDLMKDTILLENPEIGGTFFLAITARDSREGYGAIRQQERARSICRLLGYSEPTVSIVQWMSFNDQHLLEVQGENVVNVVAQTYYAEEIELRFTTARFKTLGCRKQK